MIKITCKGALEREAWSEVKDMDAETFEAAGLPVPQDGQQFCDWYKATMLRISQLREWDVFVSVVCSLRRYVSYRLRQQLAAAKKGTA